MNNVIVVTNSEDIPAALSVAASLDDYAIYAFDPALLDKLANAKLKNIKFIDCSSHASSASIREWAKINAFEIECKLDIEVKELLPGISICSWQHLSLHQLFTVIRWYSNIWENAPSYFSDCIVHVLVNSRPAYHLTCSFIPSILLIQSLLEFGLGFRAYTYTGNPIETDVLPDIFRDDDTCDFDILSHLPTCFYDYNYFNSELEASKKSILNITSRIWPVQVHATKTINVVPFDSVLNKLTGIMSNQLSNFAEKVTGILDKLLTPYISSPIYRSYQSQHLATTYKCQLATYLLLTKYFECKKPAKILLSNHDAGFLGPILAFSESNSIPVVMVTHSKIGYDLAFKGNNITHLTHPIQGDCVLDKSGKRVLNFSLAYPEEFNNTTNYPARIKKIGLLLNSISTYGVMGTSYDIYMDGIRKIHRWCVKNDLELAIRCRPGETIINALIMDIGVDLRNIENYLTMPMTEYAQGIDVCLMYDVPTTGQIDFLKRSIPILNPVPVDLPWFEAKFSNKNVIPRGNIDTILDTLDTFISDETNLFLFKNSQFGGYVNLFKNALPLRIFL